MDPIWGAFVVAIFSPLLMAFLVSRQRQRDLRGDRAWQEAYSAQAEEATRKLLESNERVAQTAAFTNGKLDVIHTLVNSNMTAAMQAELDATTRELASLREIIALKQANGLEPTAAASEAIKFTEAKIAELRATLQDRLAQTVVAEKQSAAAEKHHVD